MSFLNPSYLWALLGIVIPIAIHLWSKKEGKTIKIGSIKLLSEADSRQSSSISINEILLLAFRIAMISIVVLILANPQINRENTNTPITYIVEPSLLDNQEIASMIDSLQSQSSVRLLRYEFPELSEDAVDNKVHEVPNYWQLAKDMEKLRTDSIVVFTNAFATGLKGMRPIVKKNIDWIVLDSGDSGVGEIEASLKNDKIELLSVISNASYLSYKKEIIASNSVNIHINEPKDSVTISQNGQTRQFYLKSNSPTKILLFFDDALSNEARYIEAGLNAISEYLLHPIEINKTQDSTLTGFSTYQNIIWLSDARPRNTSARILSYNPDELANSLIVKGNTLNEFHLTTRLNAENTIDEHLTEHLIAWLNFRPDLDNNVKSFDKRVVDKDELVPLYDTNDEESSYIETLSISKWLWILLALVLITERIIAKLRKQ